MVSVDINAKDYNKVTKTFTIRHSLIGGYCSKIYLRNPKTDMYMVFNYSSTDSVNNQHYISLDNKYELVVNK